MSNTNCGLESFDQADARIIPDTPGPQPTCVTGSTREVSLFRRFVILSKAKDLLLPFCLSFPRHREIHTCFNIPAIPKP
jgi:hypothetical protein